MTAGVYAIINMTTGWSYVGSSTDIERRWKGHLSNFKHMRVHAPELLEAWRLGGPSAVEFEILEETVPSDEALEQAEQRWMERFSGRLYNSRKFARRPRPGKVTLLLRGIGPPDEVARARALRAERQHQWFLRQTGRLDAARERRQPPDEREEGSDDLR